MTSQERRDSLCVARSRHPGAPRHAAHNALGFGFRVSRTLSDAFPFRRILAAALEVRSHYVPHLTEKGSEGHGPKGNQVQLTSPALDASAWSVLRGTWVAPSKEAHDGEGKPDMSRRTFPSRLPCSLASPRPLPGCIGPSFSTSSHRNDLGVI